MKYLKLYEEHNIYKWNNIQKIKGKLHVNVYQLAGEMENLTNKKDQNAIIKSEDEYCDLLKKLLIGNVITFYDDNDNEITGICVNVSFNSNPYNIEGFKNEDNEYFFTIDYITITLEHDDDYIIFDDLIVIHSDIDPDFYRETKNFNL